MLLSTFDIIADQGSDFRITFNITEDDGTPIDLSEYTFRMQVRESYESPKKYIDTATADSGIDGVTEYITADAGGNVTINIPAADMDIPAREMVYDVEMTAPGGAIDRLVRGGFKVLPEVTR